MNTQIGSRQEQILSILLACKTGLSIDEISEQMQISRNAVKQHMVNLEKNSLITAAHLNATKGRPARCYVLTEQGINYFSKQYAWFCNLLLSELKEEMSSEGFTRLMQRLGKKIAHSLQSQFTDKSSSEKMETLVNIMQNLGYEASIDKSNGQLSIRAVNCVFHDLAQQHSELCEFDISLIQTLLGEPIEHAECMAKQGNCCRFVCHTDSQVNNLYIPDLLT